MTDKPEQLSFNGCTTKAQAANLSLKSASDERTLEEKPSAEQAEQAGAVRSELEPHIPAQSIAEAAIEQLIKSGAKHYQEFHFDFHLDSHKGLRPVIVTVAFSDGPSAHELRMKAEKERDAALAEVERIKAISDNYYVLCVERQQQLDAALARVKQQERTIGGMNEAHAKLAADLKVVQSRVAELDKQPAYTQHPQIVGYARNKELEPLLDPCQPHGSHIYIGLDHPSLWAEEPPYEFLTPLYTAPVAKAQHSVPDVCDGKEQDAFEEWARKEGLDTSCHPMHWLFLDAKTNSARQGWKAALRYVRAKIAAPGKEGPNE